MPKEDWFYFIFNRYKLDVNLFLQRIHISYLFLFLMCRLMIELSKYIYSVALIGHYQNMIVNMLTAVDKRDLKREYHV